MNNIARILVGPSMEAGSLACNVVTSEFIFQSLRAPKGEGSFICLASYLFGKTLTVFGSQIENYICRPQRGEENVNSKFKEVIKKVQFCTTLGVATIYGLAGLNSAVPFKRKMLNLSKDSLWITFFACCLSGFAQIGIHYSAQKVQQLCSRHLIIDSHHVDLEAPPDEGKSENELVEILGRD